MHVSRGWPPSMNSDSSHPHDAGSYAPRIRTWSAAARIAESLFGCEHQPVVIRSVITLEHGAVIRHEQEFDVRASRAQNPDEYLQPMHEGLVQLGDNPAADRRIPRPNEAPPPAPARSSVHESFWGTRATRRQASFRPAHPGTAHEAPAGGRTP